MNAVQTLPISLWRVCLGGEREGYLRALLFFVEIVLCNRDHQLDAIQLVYLACAGVVVDGNDVDLRVQAPQLFDNALTRYMVG